MSLAKRIIKKLDKQTNQLLGSGTFAAVYKARNKDVAIKIGVSKEDSCLDYYNLIRKQKSIHAPVVYKLRQPAENYYVCEMELLTVAPVASYELINEIESYLDFYTDASDILTFIESNNYFSYIPNPDSFVYFLDFLKNNKPENSYLDLHQNNCMIRPDGVLVITDPWCSSTISTADTLED